MVHAATRELLTAHRELVYVLRDTRKRKAKVRKDVTGQRQAARPVYRQPSWPVDRDDCRSLSSHGCRSLLMFVAG